jgi:hypothetical protein
MTKRNPTRGVGWSAGCEPPHQLPQKLDKSYSYVEQSPGYCELVLKTVQKALNRPNDIDFSDLFGQDGEPVHSYSKSLDVGGRGALLEISRTSPMRLWELGITA